MMLSGNNVKTLKVRNNKLIEHFAGSETAFQKISKPFTPDIIVYCKSNYIYTAAEGSTEEVLEDLQARIRSFEAAFGHEPKVLLVKGLGLIGVGDHAVGAGGLAQHRCGVDVALAAGELCGAILCAAARIPHGCPATMTASRPVAGKHTP